ncbi:NYN domain-containing protein [Ramlibacter sp. USB13]|uniref:NYN domain-containing protein n=1 Tax=Ramlibacter cellulosilyticus TaxID=2764187 RepID=A0A923MVY4_9BURK|nr:NYN domain-containing protein [Ramlibacter cellulosilyticus]MBC5786076.1 NYN domain-containing protein [Ramlibacter cellulosilyticus]
MNDSGKLAALLVDADNVTAQCVEHALADLAQRGLRVNMRRAYGGGEKLTGMKDCLLRHAVRPFVNQGTGTTDALLVVDAMDLLHAGRLPDVLAIASSDADFAPLAVRLREAGIHVICFAQEGKSADGALSRCYDELVYVDVPSRARHAPPPAPAPKPPRAAAKKAAAAARAPADPARAVLESIPGFREGREVPLNTIVRKLRDEGLLGKTASGPGYLRRHAGYVELLPADNPNKARLKP